MDGVAAPPGTPKEIAKKIADAIGQGFREADLKARIERLEADPLGSTPEQMRDLIKQSTDIWEPVVKARNISVDYGQNGMRSGERATNER